MYLFFLFNLIAITNGYYFGEERLCNVDNKEECIDNIVCSWCNITSKNNTMSICKNAGVCSTNFTQENDCLYSDNYKSFCNFYGFLAIVFFLFVMACTTYSLSYVVLQNFEDNNRKKNQCTLIITISGLVYIPGLILWFTYSKYLVFYLFSLILLSFFTCLFGGARKYINYKHQKNNETYSLIN